MSVEQLNREEEENWVSTAKPQASKRKVEKVRSGVKRAVTQKATTPVVSNEHLTIEEFTDRVIKEFQPMFRHIVIGRNNRVMDSEDYVQEINSHVCRVISKRFDEMRVFNQAQLRASIRTMATNIVKDLVGFYTRRPDTSLVETSLSVGTETTDEDLEYSGNTSRSIDVGDAFDAFQDFQSTFDLQVVELTLSRFHEPYCPGITRYFQECLNPSEEVAEAFLRHRSKQTRPRNTKDGYIPPTLLAQILGLPMLQLEEYKRRIRSVLNQYDLISGLA